MMVTIAAFNPKTVQHSNMLQVIDRTIQSYTLRVPSPNTLQATRITLMACTFVFSHCYSVLLFKPKELLTSPKWQDAFVFVGPHGAVNDSVVGLV